MCIGNLATSWQLQQLFPVKNFSYELFILHSYKNADSQVGRQQILLKLIINIGSKDAD